MGNANWSIEELRRLIPPLHDLVYFIACGERHLFNGLGERIASLLNCGEILAGPRCVTQALLALTSWSRNLPSCGPSGWWLIQKYR